MLFLLLPLIEVLVFNADNTDPEQRASDLGLHCLPVSIFSGMRGKNELNKTQC